MSILDKELKRKHKKPKGPKNDKRRRGGIMPTNSLPGYIKKLDARERPLFRKS